MADKRRTQDDSICRITHIRTKNNDLWMGLLALALKCAPEEAKKLIREISDNDAAVTVEMRNISNATDGTN